MRAFLIDGGHGALQSVCCKTGDAKITQVA